MAEIIRFPASRRIPATAIPRERFEELAQLSLDLVDQIVALLAESDASQSVISAPQSAISAEGAPKVAIIATFGAYKPDVCPFFPLSKHAPLEAPSQIEPHASQ